MNTLYKNNFVFLDKVSSANDGAVLYTDAEDFMQSKVSSITLYISGTASTILINFEGMDINGNFYPLACANLSSVSVSSSATALPAVWYADLVGIYGFRTSLVSIDAGYVTITGRVNYD